MSRALIFLITIGFSIALSLWLVVSLPGHYHLDETAIQSNQELNWTQSWDHPEQSIASLIATTFRYSFTLQFFSFCLVLIFSLIISLGVVRFHRLRRYTLTVLSLGISAPALLWIPLIVYIFSLKLNLLPLRFEPTIQGWMLPLFALTIRPFCLSTSILLSELQLSEKQTYFLVARSKGLSRFHVYLNHGLKNSLIPYTTQMGNFLAQSVAGSVLVESLFSFPGLGTLFIESIKTRDLPLVLVLTVVFTIMMVLVHSAVEISNRYLEPRNQQVPT